MKLYVGSRDYRPEGYKTLDIDVASGADIIGDICKLSESVAPESCDEIVAGHVLEHIDWPDSFKAISEFQRVLKFDGVLKIAVPDVGLLSRMFLNSASSDFFAMGLLYGVGGRVNKFEQHRYGFTSGMLLEILETLGFGNFDWWNSDIGDASNSWVPQAQSRNTALSLNVKATKQRPPLVDQDALFAQLIAEPLGDFVDLAARLAVQGDRTPSPSESPRLYQRIHMHLIEARQRVFYLEKQIAEMSK